MHFGPIKAYGSCFPHFRTLGVCVSLLVKVTSDGFGVGVRTSFGFGTRVCISFGSGTRARISFGFGAFSPLKSRKRRLWHILFRHSGPRLARCQQNSRSGTLARKNPVAKAERSARVCAKAVARVFSKLAFCHNRTKCVGGRRGGALQEEGGRSFCQSWLGALAAEADQGAAGCSCCRSGPGGG